MYNVGVLTLPLEHFVFSLNLKNIDTCCHILLEICVKTNMYKLLLMTEQYFLIFLLSFN